MGKYTLLIVLAATLGGSMLTFSQRLAAHGTDQRRADDQASLLARQIAESGLNVALATAFGDGGFVDAPSFFASFGTDPRGYNGGFYQADSFRSYDMGRRADLVVSGLYGPGASPARHVLASSYEFDPMDYPGPIWLDVPYATSSGSPAHKVEGRVGPAQATVALDSHVDLAKATAVGKLLDLGAMQTAVRGAIGASNVQFSNGLKSVAKQAGLGEGNVLDDLNVDNAEDLYQTVLSAKTSDDRTLAADAGGTHTVTNAAAWTGPTTITHVEGSLHVGAGGRITGEGVLVISGDLVVESSGRLDWDGLVIVRSDDDAMRVKLQGPTRVRGGLVVTQEAMPQIGHMDMTVLKDATGTWADPWGTYGPKDGTSRPWYHHTHKFDDDPSVRVSDEQRVARFVHDGDAALNQDARLHFQQTLDALGSDDVQLRFANTAAHGHAVYTVDLAGEDAISGPVRAGFPEGLRQGGSFTTRPFRASDLDAFTVDVRSLPALQRLWDPEGGCSQPTFPQCVGRDRNRKDALTVQILRSGTPVYEAAMYWHVRVDEWAAHEAKMAAWRADVLATGSFGLDLDLSEADVVVDLPKIVRLSERLGFAGNRVSVLHTSARHVPAGASGRTVICHAPGTPAERTLSLASQAFDAHLAHGDRMGACASSNAGSNPTGNGQGNASGSGNSGPGNGNGRSNSGPGNSNGNGGGTGQGMGQATSRGAN